MFRIGQELASLWSQTSNTAGSGGWTSDAAGASEVGEYELGWIPLREREIERERESVSLHGGYKSKAPKLHGIPFFC